MKLSIIIPIHNAQEFLGQTLGSIICAMRGQEDLVEVIGVDDCSTDKSAIIFKRFSEEFSNFILLKNQVNSGVSFSRNEGLNVASGEYVWFVDSDDLISEDAITVLLQNINRSMPEILCFEATIFTPNAKFPFLSEKYRTILKTLSIRESWLAPLFLITNVWLCCIRKDFLKNNNIRFDPQLRCFEDWYFMWKTSSLAKSAKFIPLSLYQYRAAFKQSLTSSYSASSDVNNLFDVFDRAFSLVEKHAKFGEERFCNLRANDIFLHFLRQKKKSPDVLYEFIDRYGEFLTSLHPLMFESLLTEYPPEDAECIKRCKSLERRREAFLEFYLEGSKFCKYKKRTTDSLAVVRAPFAFIILWLRSLLRFVLSFFKMSIYGVQSYLKVNRILKKLKRGN